MLNNLRVLTFLLCISSIFLFSKTMATFHVRKNKQFTQLKKGVLKIHDKTKIELRGGEERFPSSNIS